MANTQKKDYVSDLLGQLQAHPHLVVIGFNGTTHKRLEDLRAKLRASSEKAPTFMILKNSLFKVAFEYHNKKNNLLTDSESTQLKSHVKGQAAVMLMNDEWPSALKVIKEFAKEEEGFNFLVGMIDKNIYEEAGLTQLANLPGRDELAVKIILALRSSQTRIAYGLKFNSMKLVNVLHNAAKAGAGAKEAN